MKLFGYTIYTSVLSPTYLKDCEGSGQPFFGISAWTYNVKQQKRKGMYLHIWLFGYRLDLNPEKYYQIKCPYCNSIDYREKLWCYICNKCNKNWDK